MSDILFRISVFCGVVPLIAGIAIFVVWLLTRWRALEMAGVYTIMIGIGFFVVGAICLLGYIALEYRTGLREKSAVNRRIASPALLLIANWPVALILFMSAGYILETYSVEVVNMSRTPVESFLITGPDIKVELGPIEVEGRKTEKFRFRREGTLAFQAVAQGKRFVGTIDGYVGNAMGGDKLIEIKSAGDVTIQDRKP